MSNDSLQTGRRAFLKTVAAGVGLAAGIAPALGAPPQVQHASRRRKRDANMKITAVKTFKFSVDTGQTVRDPKNKQALSSSYKNWLFVKVETDTELYGWGEGSIEWMTPVVETTVQQWDELLIGRDPLDVVAISDDIVDRIAWKGGAVMGSAVAALNMALYDIAGKAWKAPVYQILGGKKRDRVKIYNGSINFESVERAVAGARQAVAAGARALKGNPLEGRTWPMDHRELERATQIVRAVREAVGPDVDLLLDTHGSPIPALSIAYARMVAPYRPLFLEEPCKVGSIAALKEVTSNSPVPIATGEKLFSQWEFEQLIDARACAFLQPDMSHSFGITNLLRIAQSAEAAQMLMAPHNAGGPIHFAALLQADAAIGNFLIQEVWNMERFSKYVDHDFRFQDGYIELNDRHGLGIDVDENHLAKLPYKRMKYRQYRHADGSWKGW